MAVEPNKNGLPPGITAAVKPIEKDKNEIEIVFSANNKAPLGEFTGVLQGTIKHEKTTVVQAAPALRLKLQAPFELKVEAGADKLARGGNLKVKASVTRNPAFSGPVNVTLQNLPKGVTAPAGTIAADKNEVEIQLTAAGDAQQGAVNNINVKGEAMAGKAKLEGTSPNISLNVE